MKEYKKTRYFDKLILFFFFSLQFGYVNLEDPESIEVLSKYSPPKDANTIMVFQENTHLPIVQVSMKDLPINTLAEMLEAHQYLQLPRLSSQEIFDTLCPAESAKTRKRLCVVLISVHGIPEDEEQKRNAMRNFIAENKFSPDRVRFTYVLKDKQKSFVQSLEEFKEDPEENVVILWRMGETNLKYQWLGR